MSTSPILQCLSTLPNCRRVEKHQAHLQSASAFSQCGLQSQSAMDHGPAAQFSPSEQLCPSNWLCPSAALTGFTALHSDAEGAASVAATVKVSMAGPVLHRGVRADRNASGATLVARAGGCGAPNQRDAESALGSAKSVMETPPKTRHNWSG